MTLPQGTLHRLPLLPALKESPRGKEGPPEKIKGKDLRSENAGTRSLKKKKNHRFMFIWPISSKEFQQCAAERLWPTEHISEHRVGTKLLPTSAHPLFKWWSKGGREKGQCYSLRKRKTPQTGCQISSRKIETSFEDTASVSFYSLE